LRGEGRQEHRQGITVERRFQALSKVATTQLLEIHERLAQESAELDINRQTRLRLKKSQTQHYAGSSRRGRGAPWMAIHSTTFTLTLDRESIETHLL
jgi:hypothetical protein